MKWSIIECTFTEVVDYLKFGNDQNKFVVDDPVLAVFEFSSLGWSGAIKVAPKGKVLWATEIPGRNQNQSARSWVKPLLNNESIYKRFVDEIEKAGLNKNGIPWEILGPYCQWGEYLGDTNLSFRPSQLNEQKYKASGLLIPTPYIETLVEYYQMQVRDFCDYSFLGLREIDFQELDVEDSISGYRDAKLFRNPDRLPSEIERVWLVERLDFLLSQDINTLNLDMYFEDAVRPFVDLDIVNLESSENVEIKSKQASLINKLGWPNVYSSLTQIPRFWDSVEEITPSFPVLEKIRSDLLTFKARCESNYPVLLENPLSIFDEN